MILFLSACERLFSYTFQRVLRITHYIKADKIFGRLINWTFQFISRLRLSQSYFFKWPVSWNAWSLWPITTWYRKWLSSFPFNWMSTYYLMRTYFILKTSNNIISLNLVLLLLLILFNKLVCTYKATSSFNQYLISFINFDLNSSLTEFVSTFGFSDEHDFYEIVFRVLINIFG